MNTLALSTVLTVFAIFGFTGQSWAFGSLGHHHHGSNNGSQDDSEDTSNGGSDFSWNGTHDFGTDDNSSIFDNEGDWSETNNTDTDDNSSSDLSDDKDKHHHHHHHFDTGNFGDQLNLVDQTNSTTSGDPVPEPMTLPLLGMGLVGILLVRKLRVKA